MPLAYKGNGKNVAVPFTTLMIAITMMITMGGAAVASGLGQLSSIFLLLTHFVRKKGKLKLYITKIKNYDLIRIVKAGAPEFVNQISPAVSIFAFNNVFGICKEDRYTT